jgi:diguanylate cyclase (GGDEF)-like protein
VNESKHITITNIVKEKIKSLSIVFPSYYAKYYALEAKLLNIELNPDEILDSDLLSEKVVDHVVTLSSCTSKAIEAIETQDKTALAKILLETKALKNEIYELRKLVYEDTLTKCYLRKWFVDKYLDSEHQTFVKDGVLVMVDLDKFKNINDQFGHLVGDSVLTHIASKLKTICPNVVRFGGDEFLMLFEAQTNAQNIKNELNALLEKLQNTSFKISKGNFKTSFSYGVALFQKEDSLETVLSHADKEMYLHKKSIRS